MCFSNWNLTVWGNLSKSIIYYSFSILFLDFSVLIQMFSPHFSPSKPFRQGSKTYVALGGKFLMDLDGSLKSIFQRTKLLLLFAVYIFWQALTCDFWNGFEEFVYFTCLDSNTIFLLWSPSILSVSHIYSHNPGEGVRDWDVY